jgi:hypothetical protein
MKNLLFALRPILLYAVFACIFTLTANGFQLSRQVKQTPEVIEAYNVCQHFQQLLGENLDFARAYEATFTKNPARRREIAIVDGEFGNKDFSEISSATLVNAYKQRMQIFYLMLVLAASKDVAPVFPPEFEKIIKREVPRDVREFPRYASQLEQDATTFRAHFDNLVARYPSVTDGVHKFKSELLSAKLEPPLDHKVEPSHGYYRSRVLGLNEEFYEINGYILTKEQGKMRIVGIRFFTRLF